MGAKVTADDKEVVCKARPGSAPEFPDVCITPPTVPYPNMTWNSFISIGTFTIFISRKVVAVMMRAMFSRSVGDEPGSSVRGVITHNTSGTCRFIMGSFDVLFECTPVARDKDLLTHNHMGPCPMPPNTPPFPYLCGVGGCKDGNCK